MKTYITAFLFLLIGSAFAQTGAPLFLNTVKSQWDSSTALLFVEWGQSNLNAGGASSDSLPAQLTGQDDVRIWNWTNLDFEAIDPGVNTYFPAQLSGRFGPETMFGYHAAAYTGVPVYIYKISIGGLGLALKTLPDQSWNALETGSYYDLYIQYLAVAMDSLTARGITRIVVLGGSMQGETDGIVLTDAQAYLANRDTFTTHFKADMSLPDFAEVVGRVSIHTNIDYIDTVWAAQNAFVAESPSTRKLSSTDSYPTDGLHFYTAGIIMMGRDWFDASSSLIKNFLKL